jgi:outer membrane protein
MLREIASLLFVAALLPAFAQDAVSTRPAQDQASPQAHQAWDLPRCLARATNAALAVRGSALDNRLAGTNLASARAQRGVSLSASASHGWSATPFRTGADAAGSQSSTVWLHASVPLYTGGALTASIDRSLLLLQAGELDLEAQRRTVQLAVVQAYVRLLAAQDEIAYQQSRLPACDSALARSRALLRDGLQTEEDTLLAAGSCAEIHLAQAQAQVNRDNLREELLGWLDLPVGTPLDPVLPDTAIWSASLHHTATLNQPAGAPDPAGALPTLAALQAELQATAPDLQADSLRVAASDRSLAKARASGGPQLSLAASAGTGISDWPGGAYGQQMRDGYDHRVSVSLEIPLLDRRSAETAYEQATYERERSQLAQQQSRRDLANQTEQLWNGLQLSRAGLPAVELSLAAATRREANQRLRHAAGTLPMADLLLATASLEQARGRWRQLRWELMQDDMSLQILRGRSPR